MADAQLKENRGGLAGVGPRNIAGASRGSDLGTSLQSFTARNRPILQRFHSPKINRYTERKT